MKAVCPREGLLNACQIAGAAVADFKIKPILSNIKGVAGPNGCTLLATDLELGIRLDVRSVKVEEPGEVILPASRLTAILRESTDDELTVEASAASTMIRGQCNEFELPGADPAEFPPIPEFTDEKYHEVTAGALRDMIRRTVFATAKEATRYGVPGVLWEVSSGQLRLVATDGRRLALAATAVASQGAADTKSQPHIVPTKAMGLLERLLQDAGETVKLSLRANDALFKTERATVCTRLVEGRFPPYQELVNKKLPVKVVLDSGRFHSAVRQANIMTGEDSRCVRFNFAKQKLTLQAEGRETGRAKVEMPVEFDGKEVAIGFDPGYLIEMLRVLAADAPLTLEMLDGNAAALFRSGPDYVYMAMPLSLKE